jgi:Ca-activated chloride channel family protein
MSVASWIRTPRIRRAIAAGAVIVSTGGLVLLRAPTGEQGLGLVAPHGSNAQSFQGPGLKGTLALSHGTVGTGPNFELFADLRLDASVESKELEVAPISMAIVLDTSGSMTGEKIEEAKRSVVRLVRDMHDNDEIAFVRYSDGSETVQPLARVGDVRESLIRRIEEIQASGGTNIPSGLRRGRDALTGARPDRVKRVVLVSDGLDSSRREAERLATDAAEHGVTTSSLGIGLDFDESYMSGVANVGHGNFGFVKDGAALAQFLQKELRETTSTVVVGAAVRIKVPEGARFVRATGAEARVEGNEVVVRVGSLFSGDQRRVLLEFQTQLSPGQQAAFVASANWDRVGGKHIEVQVDPLRVVASNDARAVAASRDPDVWARAVSVTATRRQIEASEAYSRGDRTRGDALILQNEVTLKAAASAAPAPRAAELNAQWRTYEADKKTFGQGGQAVNPAAKSVLERELGNAKRATSY